MNVCLPSWIIDFEDPMFVVETAGIGRDLHDAFKHTANPVPVKTLVTACPFCHQALNNPTVLSTKITPPFETATSVL